MKLFIICLLSSIVTSVGALAQDVLRGVVLGKETNEVLVGASVYLSGTIIGTQSDLSGHFSLDISQSNLNDSLVVTHIGYKKYTEALSAIRTKSSYKFI